MSTQLTFQDITLSAIERDKKVWLTSADLTRALGYSSDKAISNIYSRRKDEFTNQMTLVVKLMTKGFGNGQSAKDTRVFSLRGAHLIAMFSRTPVAKDFRKWVLDVLDKESDKHEAPIITPVMPPKTLRLLMVMEKGHIVSTQVVPDDSLVFGLSEIPELIREPGYFSINELKRIADLAMERITEYAQHSYLPMQ